MAVQQWVAECEDVGLSTGVDSRDLVHVVTTDGWRNCAQSEDREPPWALGRVTETTRVCMWCRELPGRERRYLVVAQQER